MAEVAAARGERDGGADVRRQGVDVESDRNPERKDGQAGVLAERHLLSPGQGDVFEDRVEHPGGLAVALLARQDLAQRTLDVGGQVGGRAANQLKQTFFKIRKTLHAAPPPRHSQPSVRRSPHPPGRARCR